jgi:two-component system, OmpR family, phosphate regulon sensor histidine kinase PhoR
MKMRGSAQQRNLFFIVGIIIVSLIGVQLYWMTTTIRLQKLAAERNLKSDLDKVIKEVEEDAFCFYFYSKAYIKKDEGIYLIKQQYKDGKFIAPPTGYLDTLSMYNVFYLQKDTVFDRSSYLDFQTPATVDISLKFKYAVPSPHVSKIDTNSYKLPNIDMAGFRQRLSNSQTLDELINPGHLDTLITETLKKNDFDTVFEMGIKRSGSNKYEYLRPGTKPAHLEKGIIKISMLGDNFNKPYELFLHLPDPLGHAVRSMAVVMVSSIFIIIVLIFSYAWFVKTILDQKKLSEMKSMFINNITHEFNTPITNINLAIENWRNAGTNNPFYANIIEEENRHLQKNVEQMLQLAMIEHTRLITSLDHIDINGLIQETVNSFGIQLKKIKGTIECHLTPGLMMYGDRQLICNLLYNLIDNSIKYSKEDLLVTISAFESGGRIAIEIQDNGIGMSAETMKYMFEHFYRGDKSDRHDVKGFGIGLSYVKYIVDAHKGVIQVKSKKGIGTKFTILFPANLNSL